MNSLVSREYPPVVQTGCCPTRLSRRVVPRHTKIRTALRVPINRTIWIRIIRNFSDTRACCFFPLDDILHHTDFNYDSSASVSLIFSKSQVHHPLQYIYIYIRTNMHLYALQYILELTEIVGRNSTTL